MSPARCHCATPLDVVSESYLGNKCFVIIFLGRMILDKELAEELIRKKDLK
jgi:hypothetical protein